MQKRRSVKVLKSSDILLLVTGIVFIIGATVIGFVIECPTRIQCLNVYTLIGIGTACIFFNSAEQSTVSYKSLKLSIKIVGCIAVPILLYIINPIDKIKVNGCDASMDVTIFEGPPGSQNTGLRQQNFEKAPELRLDSSTVNKPDSFHLKTPVENITMAKNKTVQCKGLTKKGMRCKHKTGNVNGYCFQHQPG